MGPHLLSQKYCFAILSISSKYYFVQAQAEKILQPGPEALEMVAMNSLCPCKWEVLWLLAAWGALISGLNI